jgi:hypothetical protein
LIISLKSSPALLDRGIAVFFGDGMRAISNAGVREKTGYPIVDAGMRELNTTGFMHNRV